MGAVSAAAKKTWDDALRRVRADMSKDATTSGRRTRGGLEGASPASTRPCVARFDRPAVRDLMPDPPGALFAGL